MGRADSMTATFVFPNGTMGVARPKLTALPFRKSMAESVFASSSSPVFAPVSTQTRR